MLILLICLLQLDKKISIKCFNLIIASLLAILKFYRLVEILIMPSGSNNNDDGILGQDLVQIEDLKAQIADMQIQRVPNAQVDALKVPKHPDFFRKDPGLWYTHVDSMFRNSRITVDTTEVNYIVPALGFGIILCIKDLITATPKPEYYYEMVKECVISTYSSSSESRL